MISHVSVGVEDIANAGRFYDAALASLGYKRSGSSRRPLGPCRNGSLDSEGASVAHTVGRLKERGNIHPRQGRKP
jgi:hypothetical protein